ncbi:hypothetical protein [Synoicihabitans lomoniglobus]|uniref:Uncharacterized protein n=1 Tax=Synoicihabitans lomoniglobus TaxID=2909285 RepID=A0AAF0CR50_9BACT|nr:hypothetical protein [Opitutaceae bacterium LMO-M01]WED66528.1 hypothetical protein PXH66_06655 [Opitutaceae bacterium LMO-M01]
MKRLLLTLCFAATTLTIGAHDVAIYARSEAYVIGATAPDLGTDPKQKFWAAFKNAVAEPKPWPSRIPMTNPPAWGKTVSANTGGALAYREMFPGGFFCHLSLHDLAPNQRYILTLNGNPELAGNEFLPTPVPGLEAERYYDFAFIETDAAGRYEATLGIKLTPGNYDVRLYVKDTADFKIVSYHDYFPFTVTE